MPLAIVFAAILLFAPVAYPADGVLEINQTCAVQTGCFPGDADGFPVTITVPGSYRLTGNLTQPDPAVHAIHVQASVSLDLGGFTVAGPATCTGSGATLSCGPTGSGIGVFFDSGADGSRVVNGTVRGAGSTGLNAAPDVRIQVQWVRALNNGLDGISGQTDMIVRDCTTIQNAEDGIDVDQASIVDSTIAVGNGNDGIEIDGESGMIRGSVARGNGAAGINAAASAVVSETTSSENAGEGFKLGANSQFWTSTSRANGLADDCGGSPCQFAEALPPRVFSRSTEVDIIVATTDNTTYTTVASIFVDAPEDGTLVVTGTASFLVGGDFAGGGAHGPFAKCIISKFGAEPPGEASMIYTSWANKTFDITLTGHRVFDYSVAGGHRYELKCHAHNPIINDPLDSGLVTKNSLTAIWFP